MKTGPCERCGHDDWNETTRTHVTKSGKVSTYRHRKCRECNRRRKRERTVREAYTRKDVA